MKVVNWSIDTNKKFLKIYYSVSNRIFTKIYYIDEFKYSDRIMTIKSCRYKINGHDWVISDFLTLECDINDHSYFEKDTFFLNTLPLTLSEMIKQKRVREDILEITYNQIKKNLRQPFKI